MTRIGILSVRNEECRFWERWFQPITEKESLTEPVSCLVAQIPWTEMSFSRLSARKRRRLCRRGKDFLRRQGADLILMDHRLFPAKEREERIVLPISEKRFSSVIAYALNNMGDRASTASVCWYERKIENLQSKALEELCEVVRYLTIVTDATHKAEEMADQFYDVYGICVEVLPYSVETKQQSDLMIDRDNRRIRVGENPWIDGMEVALTLGGYPLLISKEETDLAELEEVLPFCGWVSSKKGL